MNMDIDRYFERIYYAGSREPSVETLRGLHRAHLRAVPFENLDIHLGRRIVLDEAALFEKIVTQRRGGFCYELNGLFAVLLRALGFEVTLLEARVSRGDGTFGIPFDHLTLAAQLDVRWLVEVGFGDSFLEPLRLDDSDEQARGEGVFRVEHNGTRGIYTRHVDGEWRDQYEFYLAPRTLSDFAGGCHYHQTSPQTTFTQRRVCSLATPEGRITLSDQKLITTRHGERDEREVLDEAAFQAALRTFFDIDLGL